MTATERWSTSLFIILASLIASFSLFLLVPSASERTVPEYPVPISSYAEQSSPNTITLLSYPKYYQGAGGALVPVITNFAPSQQPGWDYEVSTGIWTLLLRRDGAFSARHGGDIFSYRLSDYGLATAAGFQTMARKTANWSEFSLLGDTVQWSNVYPGIHLKVRYIHDILKVDVILSEEARARIANEPEVAKAAADDALTFRFSMDNSLIQAEAVRDRSGARDLNAAFDIDGPLAFARNGKVQHKLRPAVAWVLDAYGTPDREAEPIPMNLRWDGTQAVKQIEIGIGLDDLAQAPAGRIALDPSITIDNDLDDNIDDTRLDGATPLGSDTTMWWYDDESIAIAPKLDDLGIDKVVTKAELSVYEWYSSLDTGTTSRAYWITEAWSEGYATSTARTSSENWTTPGGTYTTTNQSPEITLPDDDDEWITWDVTDMLKAYYPNHVSVFDDQGFLLKMTSSSSGKLKLYSAQYTTASLRPKMVVTYSGSNPIFGADLGNAWDVPDVSPQSAINTRMACALEDHIYSARLFPNSIPTHDGNFLSKASTEGIDTVMVLGVYSRPLTPMPSPGSPTPVQPTPEPKATQIKLAVEKVMEQLQHPSVTPHVGTTIMAVEIGNELDVEPVIDGWRHAMFPRSTSRDYWPHSTPIATETDYYGRAEGLYNSGKGFAEYYVPMRDAIKTVCPELDIISGGSTYQAYSVDWYPSPHPVGSGAEAFLKGFIDGVMEIVTPTPNIDHYAVLPEVIAIHDYARDNPPERHDNVNVNGFIDRLDALLEICEDCTDSNYRPQFANSEWAVDYWHDAEPTTLAARPTTTETPPYPARLDVPERQGIHYVRRILLDQTNLCEEGDRGWKYSLYFHHPRDDVFNQHSFHEWELNTIGTPRPIRKAARILFEDPGVLTPRPAIGVSDTRVWIPAYTVPATPVIDQQTGDQEPRMMYCGWVTDEGQRWGALWQYKSVPDQRPTPTPDFVRYYEATPAAKDFEVPGNFSSYYAEPYKFYDLDDYSQTDFEAVPNSTPIAGTYDSTEGVTSYTIPDVNHNPTFLRFVIPD